MASSVSFGRKPVFNVKNWNSGLTFTIMSMIAASSMPKLDALPTDGCKFAGIPEKTDAHLIASSAVVILEFSKCISSAVKCLRAHSFPNFHNLPHTIMHTSLSRLEIYSSYFSILFFKSLISFSSLELSILYCVDFLSPRSLSNSLLVILILSLSALAAPSAP